MHTTRSISSHFIKNCHLSQSLDRIMHQRRSEMIFISLTLLTSVTAEWVEITKQPIQTTSSSPKPKIKILRRSDLNPFQNYELTTPSPYWIAYQYERFGTQPHTRPQGVVVTTDHLSNSAQVMAAANSKNHFVNTRTRLDVVRDKPVEAVGELPQAEVVQVGTTPRKDMSLENYPEEEYVDATNGADSVETENDGQLQFPSLQGFLDFLKSMRKTWLKMSKFNFEQKIQYLKKLRDTLMRKIEQQFNILWPPESERQRRSKRGLLEESSLNFPPQTAIMTINFLTFAVFLIKLVLQVVHIVRSKHYSFGGFNVNTQTVTG